MGKGLAQSRQALVFLIFPKALGGMKYINILEFGAGGNQDVWGNKENIVIRLPGNFFNRPFFRNEQGVGQDSRFFAYDGDIALPIVITVKFNTNKMFPRS